MQPNLDHTKGFAHAFRELGKFGSHSSHDGFDDESSSLGVVSCRDSPRGSRAEVCGLPNQTRRVCS